MAGIGARLLCLMSLTSKWVLERGGCQSATAGFLGGETGGVVAGVGWNWNDALFPLAAAPATVIKCLIVASWEFTLNISSSVIIIWVWVGRGCNHLGLLFDEILGLVVLLYSHYFCVNSFPQLLLTSKYGVFCLLINTDVEFFGNLSEKDTMTLTLAVTQNMFVSWPCMCFWLYFCLTYLTLRPAN